MENKATTNYFEYIDKKYRPGNHFPRDLCLGGVVKVLLCDIITLALLELKPHYFSLCANRRRNRKKYITDNSTVTTLCRSLQRIIY